MIDLGLLFCSILECQFSVHADLYFEQNVTNKGCYLMNLKV